MQATNSSRQHPLSGGRGGAAELTVIHTITTTKATAQIYSFGIFIVIVVAENRCCCYYCCCFNCLLAVSRC